MHLYVIITLTYLLSAQYAYAITAERPILTNTAQHDTTLWLQHDLFTPSMDILDYSGNFAPTAATLNYYRTTTLGATYAPLTNINLSYVYATSENHVTRFTEPKSINTQTTYQTFRGQYIILDGASFSLALEAGWNAHTSPTVHLYQYDIGNISVTWPGHALLSTDSEDSAILAAIRLRYQTEQWDFHYGYERRFVDVSVQMTSESTTITKLLASQIPQTEPWSEVHNIQQLGIDYHFFSTWTFALDYQNFDITRHGYTPRNNKIDYSANDTLDLYLLWQASDMLKPYIHAKLSRRSTLGDNPLAYNQRTNHKFKHPFGYLGMGLAFNF